MLSVRQAFCRGLVVDLSNPKAAGFFTSLFAVTVPPDSPIWFQVLVVAAVASIAGGWYALAACVVNAPPVAAMLRKSQRAVAYVTGMVFIALGARLATDR